MRLKISVGMTTYNSEKYVEEQLESIFSQTTIPDELIISDDCSQDNTVRIVKSFIERYRTNDMQVLVIENNKNIGYAKNFEQCFLRCNGDVVISCDADDIWFPCKVETMKNCFGDLSVTLAFHDAIVIDADKNVKAKSLYNQVGLDWTKKNEELLLRAIKRQGFPWGMTMAFRRSILTKAAPFSFAHDEWIWLCTLALGKVEYIDAPLIYYRRHGKNASGNNGEKFLSKVTN